MKRIIIGFALAAVSCIASAQSSFNSVTDIKNQLAADSRAINAGSGNGVNSVNFEAAKQRGTSKLLTTPDAIAPGNAVAFSIYNCAGTQSGAVSAYLVAVSLGKMSESFQCNGRANAVTMIQIAATLRGIGTPVALIAAEQLEKAAITMMCMQDEFTYAALNSQGACPAIDFSYHAQQRDRLVTADNRVRIAQQGNAQPYYPQSGGQ